MQIIHIHIYILWHYIPCIKSNQVFCDGRAFKSILAYLSLKCFRILNNWIAWNNINKRPLILFGTRMPCLDIWDELYPSQSVLSDKLIENHNMYKNNASKLSDKPNETFEMSNKLKWYYTEKMKRKKNYRRICCCWQDATGSNENMFH